MDQKRLQGTHEGFYGSRVRRLTTELLFRAGVDVRNRGLCSL